MPVDKAAKRFADAIEKDQFLVTTGIIGPFYYGIKKESSHGCTTALEKKWLRIWRSGINKWH
jgi:hypothetical protein